MADLHESPYIFGIHEPGGERHMAEQGRKGWIVFTEALGTDPNAQGGQSYTQWSNDGFGVIARINNGYNPAGTIPHPNEHENFARRCANFVRASQGCHIWIIGNEMNYQVEWPGAFALRREIPATRGDDPERTAGMLRELPHRFSALHPALPRTRSSDQGDPITPEKYGRCYTLCRNAIKSVPGHEQDQVLVGAVAPWNIDTQYEGNPTGDWVQYLRDILTRLGPDGCDGITIHTYTHGTDPNLIHDAARMEPPFQQRHYHFFTYRDFMQAIPANMRHLPVYLTEMDQDHPWEDANRGWVKRAYGEIDHWNRQPGNQQIRAAILYRWPNIDRWVIEGKNGVINDFREAMQNEYRWNPGAVPSPAQPPPPAEKVLAAANFKHGDRVRTATTVNLRRSPGVTGKGADDVVAQLPKDTAAIILEGPQIVDNLVWWRIQSQVEGQQMEGWSAQAISATVPLLAPEPTPAATDQGGGSGGKFAAGQTIYTTTYVNLRRTPGYVGKTADDIVVEIPHGRLAKVDGGPQHADNLTWWRVAYTTPERQTFQGWTAEGAPSGQELLSTQPPPPPKPIQPPAFSTYKVGDAVCNISLADVNVRKSPGFRNKPPDDVVALVPSKGLLRLAEGPREADGLHWWRVQGQGPEGHTLDGWMAEVSPTGVRLLAPALYRDAIRLSVPYQGNQRVSQLWGDNAAFYRQFTYDGVPLRGHNGIDFAMNIGTPLVSVDNGVVETVGSSPTGFGNWVMVDHRWGHSVYAHMNRVTVREGQQLQRGDVLGESGNTGTSTGPHLHFSIRINPYFRADGWGGYCDPLPFMNASQLNIPPSTRGEGEPIMPPSPPPIEEPGRPLP